MKLTFALVVAATAVILMDPTTVVVNGTRVRIWPAQVDTVMVQKLWTWDTTCATRAVKELPGHGWRNVTWLGANLLEAGSNPAAQVDTTAGIGPHVIGYWEGDTIFLDTGVVLHAVPWFMHNLVAHELLHQLLNHRVPVDSAVPERVREVADSAHPIFPFLYPCRLINLAFPVVDSE